MLAGIKGVRHHSLKTLYRLLEKVKKQNLSSFILLARLSSGAVWDVFILSKSPI